MGAQAVLVLNGVVSQSVTVFLFIEISFCLVERWVQQF